MASAVQQCVLSPLPDLTALKSNNNVFEEGQGSHDGLLRGGSASGSSRDQDALPAATQTPTSSSSDRTSERRNDDPVALLSRPVEGFHHPRQHLFTDRLVGRFYVDTSLDAETRKTSKCLAGRLGTAGNNTATTRPSSTAGGAASLLRSRSLHSPTAGRCGKRMLGSASGHSQGMSKGGSARPQAGGGVGTALSGRKEQVQKEIMEQKALIEKLEGKMASLSSRGGRSSKSDNSAVHAAAADARRSTAQNQDDDGGSVEDVGRGPDLTQRPEFLGRASRGEGILVDSEYYCGDAKAAEHGSTAGRELGPADGYQPQSGPGKTRLRSREEDTSAVVIQRNVRGAGRRKSFLLLQSARDEFVHNLQSVVSAATSLTRQTQQPKPPTTVVDSENSSSTSGVGRVQGICAAAERMIDASREEGLAKPPFDILRALYSGMANIEESLASLKAEVDGGRATDMGEHDHEPCAAMAESCRAARRALGVLAETVGADTVIGELTSACSSAATPAIPRDHLNSPAGSGRAAAVAMASAREGLLISPDSCGRVDGPNAENKERIQELPTDRGDTGQSPPVPLNTLGVEGIGILLRMHGFEEHAAGFLTQAVDGVMLSDPNLCEADFAELGLGGDTAGADECRARMVSFFRRCQEQGAVVHYRDQGVAPPGAEAAAGASESGLSQRGYASQTNDRKQADGEPGAVEDIRAGCSVVGGQGGDRMVSEPLWHRHAAQLEPQSQQIIADISVDADEGSAASAAAGGSNPRISVKLNGGVVVTVGGVEADLIDDADRLSDAETDDENAGGGSGKTPPVIPDVPPTNRQSRRTSVGFRQVTLEADPARNGERGSSDGGDAQLSPGIAVTTADVTLNVFSDGESRP